MQWSAIFNLIFKHANELRPVDFILVAMFVLFVGYGLFHLMNWAYLTRIESLEGAVRAKEEEASSYQRLYASATTEKKELEGRLERLNVELGTVRSNFDAATADRDQLLATTRRLVSNVNTLVIAALKFEGMVLVYTLLSATELMVLGYYGEVKRKFPDTPSKSEVLKELFSIHSVLADAVAGETLTLPAPSGLLEVEVTVSENVRTFDPKAQANRINNIWKKASLTSFHLPP